MDADRTYILLCRENLSGRVNLVKRPASFFPEKYTWPEFVAMLARVNERFHDIVSFHPVGFLETPTSILRDAREEV